MNKQDIASRLLRVAAARKVWVVAVLACLLAGGAQPTSAAEWRNLTPLKSRRADVERELGKPLSADTASGALNFKVAGGIVTVTFVTAKFAQTKKLPPSLEGTVLLIVLQHENSSDTPDSVGLVKKSGFTREEKGVMAVYTNQKDGITYTFFNGRLKTTRYAPSTDQLGGSQGVKSVL
ncbi:MAG TPA: hypothetical protein VEX70_08875 [Pyrinomonadaceae bacterium]|jgi:hypothetical protein|nr:hypothetical protein [Pyrinomonadaceae bacterium]